MEGSKHEDNSGLIQKELDELDALPVTIDGLPVKPSQCYHFSGDPVHILYNTNCPDELRYKLEAILSRYQSNRSVEGTVPADKSTLHEK